MLKGLVLELAKNWVYHRPRPPKVSKPMVLLKVLVTPCLQRLQLLHLEQISLHDYNLIPHLRNTPFLMPSQWSCPMSLDFGMDLLQVPNQNLSANQLVMFPKPKRLALKVVWLPRNAKQMIVVQNMTLSWRESRRGNDLARKPRLR